jgi:hypothetical protein
MAIYHGNTAVLTLGAVDLSDRVTSVTLSESVDTLDTEAMGDTHKRPIGGLRSFTLSVTFHQDQAAGETYATIQPLVGTVAAFTLKAAPGATSNTNRLISGSVLVTEFDHINSEIGSLDSFSVTWPGSGALTIATT